MPNGLQPNILFNPIDRQIGLDQHIRYETGTGGIEIRSMPPVNGRRKYRVNVRYPEGDRAGMAVYENWFWRESQRFFYVRAADELRKKGVKVEAWFPAPILDDEMWAHRQAYRDLSDKYVGLCDAQSSHSAIPDLELKERAIAGGALNLRAALATALVLFSLCFTCIYLMPSLTCEERERRLAAGPGAEPGDYRRDPCREVSLLPGLRHHSGDAPGGHS